MNVILIVNIITLIAGICSIISVHGKNKKQIVCIEFLGTILRIISNSLVRNWSDVIAKIIKAFTQKFSLNNQFNKKRFLIMSLTYLILCLIVTYYTKDFRCLVAIVPAILEFYALLATSTRKYRWFIIVTKLFWIVNNCLFRVYVASIFDLIVVFGHLFKIKQKHK